MIRLLIKVMCLAVLTSTVIAEAQSERVIPVVEVNGTGPVRVAGRVIAKDQPSEAPRYSFEANVEMTDVSAKPILLIVVTLDALSTLPVSFNYREEKDYFFEPDMLQPGSIARLQGVLGRFGEPSRKEDFSVKVEPSARVKVAFVQFSDGSSWGEARAAEQALRNRQLSLRELEFLNEEYRQRSVEEFLSEFLQPTLLQPIFSLQELYRENLDLAPVLARLDSMLKNARARGAQ